MASPGRPQRATMADVARAAGVSLKTVSRVVNGVATVDPALRERVRQAAEELSFQPNRLAALLRSGAATHTVGVVIKDISNEFYGGIAAAASEVAARHGTRLIIAHSGENPEDETEAILDLCRRRVDGLLVVPTEADHSVLKAEAERIPLVFVDREPNSLDADTVVIDNIGGARDGVTALLEQGHARIAVIVDTLRNHTMRDRLDGARNALVAAGLELDDDLVMTGIGSPEPAARAAAALLDAAHPPSAFFCGNNRSAQGVLQLLWERRRHDVALVGFDDFSLAALMPRPLLCVSYSVRDLGLHAAELLFRRIAGDGGPSRHVLVPTQLVQRGTLEVPP